MADLYEISKTLDELLNKADLSSTTSEGLTRELPDGYYLCEVEKAELTASKNGNPMVAMRFSVVEDGIKTIINDNGDEELLPAKNTKGQKIFINYVLNSEIGLNFFVSDMLKFEDPEVPGKPLLADTVAEAKLFFKTTELLMSALEVISMGNRIYIMVQSKPRRDNPSELEKKYNLISWKRVSQLELN